MNGKNKTPQTGHIFRLSLFHLTDVNSAEKIINTQKFIPSSKGLYSTGCYFGNTLEACIYKTKHNTKITKNNMTLLVADVYVGNYIKISKSEAVKNKVDTNKIKSQGFNTILGHKMKTGREYVILDASRIRNIVYAAGIKPNVTFKLDWHRVTLFKYVTKIEAMKIHHVQSLFKTNDHFGNGYYLFDSMDDAKNNNKNGETFLACDAEVKPAYIFKNNESLRSRIPNYRKYKCFIGIHNKCSYYIFTDIRNISNIHYCGGQPWN